MKVLLAIDGSTHSEAAIVDTARGSWPDGTAIGILSVIPARARLTADPAFVMTAVHVDQIDERRRRPAMLHATASKAKHGGFKSRQRSSRVIRET
jgi:hypothetical protein